MDALKDGGNSLGQPDALLRAAPVPDGQGPAHRATRSATRSAVLDGDIDGFIEAGIRWRRSQRD